jgi:PGF-pre-PGF domain-containing protein
VVALAVPAAFGAGANAQDSSDITFSTLNVEFGNVSVGATATEQVTVTNNGNRSGSVNGLTFFGDDADAFTGTPQSFDLGPGESQTVNLSFTPTRSGDHEAKVTVVTDDVDVGSVGMPLSGTGVTGSLGAETDRLSFERTAVGAERAQSITLTNDGPGTLSLDNATVTGPGQAQFSAGSLPDTIAPNSSGSLPVTFAPNTTLVQNLNATVRVRAGSQSVAVPVDGDIAQPAVSVTPKSLNFDDATVGDSLSKTVTVTNTGDGQLRITGTPLNPSDGPFSVGSGYTDSLAAGESTDLPISFEPETNGSKSATLSVESNDPKKPTVGVYLTSSRVKAELSVSSDENTTQVDATVTSVSAGDPHNIPIPKDSDTKENASIDELSVTPETNDSFSVNITASESALDNGTEFEPNQSTKPEDVGHLNVGHNISNENIEEASITYSVSKERMQELQSEPDDFSLYRRHEGEWNAVDTELVTERDDEFVFKGSASGLSEWTAAAAVPRISVADARANVTAVTIQEAVDIRVLLNNTGGSDGRFDTKLIQNGSVVEQRQVAVDPQSTSLVNFRRGFDQPGTYGIEVNDIFVAAVAVSEENQSAQVTGGEADVQAEGTSGGSGPLSPVVSLSGLLGAAVVAVLAARRGE